MSDDGGYLLRCPRCGLDNPADSTACARCGLPVYGLPAGAPPPNPAAVGRPDPPEAGYSAVGGRPSFEPADAGPPLVVQQPLTDADARAEQERRASSTFARVVLGLALIATIVYAVWEFTARRAIFADFANGRTVSLDRASTSDLIDNILLGIAGSLAVLGLLVWLIRRASGRTTRGAADALGLVLWVLGAIAAVLGLVLLELIHGSGGPLSQGRHAEVFTVIAGGGFAVIAVSLVVGLSAQGNRAGPNVSAP